jgi:nitroreductase
MTTNVTSSLETIQLPEPAFEHSKSLFEALKLRRTVRTMRSGKLPLQILGDILWAAQGVNRRSGGPFNGAGRTSGSASNSQEVRVYVALEEGLYLYKPDSHSLQPVLAGDQRALAIGQGQASIGDQAPMRLIYVADLECFKHSGFDEPRLHDVEGQKAYYYLDTGLVAQNVYLAAPALGLAAWFHNCNRAAVEKVLGLGSDELALFGQTVGYEEA